jgi:hypothetical protein
MFRSFERIGMRPAELRPEFLDQPRPCGDGRLHRPRQRIKLGLEGRVEFDHPAHISI